MLRTIEIGSCVTVQGEIIATLADGLALVRDGGVIYRGRLVEGDAVQSLPPTRGVLLRGPWPPRH